MGHVATISTRADLARVVAANGGGPHYVYILYEPSQDGSPGTPFYVGEGQGTRIFEHEREARETTSSSLKSERIRAIWRAGGEVVRVVDSVHASPLLRREEELINSIGRIVDGQGPLTNDQGYAPSFKVDGVELRKYAVDYAITGDVDAIPPNFRLRSTRLKAGPHKPNSTMSVFGKIYAIAESNPGITGEQLIRLLQDVGFSGNKSAYTQDGRVSVSWLAKYIEGGVFHQKCQHLQIID